MTSVYSAAECIRQGEKGLASATAIYISMTTRSLCSATQQLIATTGAATSHYCLQVHWTSETEAAMRTKGNAGVHEYHTQLVAQLSDMVFLIRGDLSTQARVTIGQSQQ
jgi:hypothetical protein